MTERESAPTFGETIRGQLAASRARLSPPLSPRQRQQREQAEQRRQELEREAAAELEGEGE